VTRAAATVSRLLRADDPEETTAACDAAEAAEDAEEAAVPAGEAGRK